MQRKLIILGIIISLATSLYFAGKFIIKLTNKINDLETTVLQTDSTNKQVLLSNKMFRRVLTDKLDSIEKKTGVPSNTITHVTNVYNDYHKYDTTTYKIYETSTGIFDISYPDNTCWGFKGYYDVSTGSVSLTEQWAKSETTIFGYTQRDKWFGKKKGKPWGPKWFGTKRTFLGSYNNCDNVKSSVTEYKLKNKE